VGLWRSGPALPALIALSVDPPALLAIVVNHEWRATLNTDRFNIGEDIDGLRHG
jgi:hypothetical protein